MSNLKMILFDGTALEIEAFGLPMHAVMSFANADELLAVWKKLTPMNLSSVSVLQSDVPVYKFASGKLDGVQSVNNGDGSLTAHFYMSGVQQDVLDDSTREYVTAAQILMGEEE